MVAYRLAIRRLGPGLSQAGSGPVRHSRRRRPGGPPLGSKGRDDLWPDQPGYGNATGYRPPLRGLESGLGWGCYRQATANGISKPQPNFHHQLPSTKAVPDVGNDKGFRVPTG